MRNLPSSLLWISFIGFIYLNGFHWFYLVLLIGGIAIWEYPVKENIELVKAQIERTKAETESLEWTTKLNKASTKLNVMTMESMKNG
jgi:hypothetical protein